MCVNEGEINPWEVTSKTATDTDSRLLRQLLSASLYFLDSMKFILAEDKSSFYEFFP